MAPIRSRYDVIVVGGGHAGVEAAWAAANIGARVALLTLDPGKIGVMSCNPAVGGLAKGQMVREIDALGGLMGVATDETGIMFKILNTSKGPAVQSPRAQCDRHAYARAIRRRIESHPSIVVIAGAAEKFVLEGRGEPRRIRGVVVSARTDESVDGLLIEAPSVVLTTGTFMRGLMHTGEDRTEGGRAGEAPATGISAALKELGFELGRLKTGTPPRLRKSTIAWSDLEAQHGDDPPRPFSEVTGTDRFPSLPQLECRITATNAAIHDLIRENLHRAPMFSGQIESVGPRYCPSIEDKVVRFADRGSHHVFLEPESHESDWVYCNGIATSLPRDVQDGIIRDLEGCRDAEIVQYGYAVEYDMVRPHQIDATTQTKSIAGLFLAGQINGTSGYEEAAGQGLIAGVNAARRAAGDELVTLGRDEAYIGVMLDDLVTKTPVEPYRMFTSRAEYRLLLRADNAADRLTPLGRAWGVVGDGQWSAFKSRRERVLALQASVDVANIRGEPLARIIRRPEFTLDDLAATLNESPDGPLRTVLAERQYEGYIRRQRADVKRQAEMENRPLPGDLAPKSIQGLRIEAAEAIERFRPATLGQASRLEGVSPADMTLLIVALERYRKIERDRNAAAMTTV